MRSGQHTYHLILKRPDEIYGAAQIVASSFPEPDTVFTGIYELLINAVEHGNLHMDAQCKAALMEKGCWQEEINRRLALAPYADKLVHIDIIESTSFIRFTIQDEGDGFDWKANMICDLENRRPHGRGLCIAQASGFDSIAFNPAGNAVTCSVNLDKFS